MDKATRPERDPRAEHLSVRRAAGFLEDPERACLAVTGKDREAFLQGLLTCDVRRLPEWKGSEALLLTPKGKVIAWMVVYRRPEAFLLDCPAPARGDLAARLEMYTLSSDVAIEDLTERTAVVSLHGPLAPDLVRLVAGGAPPADLFDLRSMILPEAEAAVARVDRLGGPGFDLRVPVAAAPALRAAFAAAGARAVSPEAAETLRIEAGRVRFGVEIDGSTLPQEIPALVERAVSFTKGCFVGQETVARIRTYGHVNRELRGLVVSGAVAPTPGAELRAAGETSGVVTSACVPPTLGFPVALALLRRKVLEPGTVLETEAGGVPVQARVVPAGVWN